MSDLLLEFLIYKLIFIEIAQLSLLQEQLIKARVYFL